MGDYEGSSYDRGAPGYDRGGGGGGPPGGGGGEGDRKLFIGGLDWDLDDESLRAIFDKCGPIETAKVSMCPIICNDVLTVQFMREIYH